ncbi:hypothetical protein AB0L40_11805 [Patulibacter sp. NPDC049589]|uniref:hypothetical protein n=1 Tax=Patulibacter sp. NPDC049589 TaxID=3154731 RepID=UPI00344010FD
MIGVDRGGRLARRLLSVLALLLVAGGAAEARAASTTLQTGFMDNAVLKLPDADRNAWLGRAKSVGASVMRINLRWDDAARVRPGPGAGTDPTWVGYDFALVDAQVRSATAAGMSVLLNVGRAPAWAQEGGRPKSFSATTGAWKPDPYAYNEFMTAVARRYSGTVADPLVAGRTLPKVENFQIWNEPNLNLYLGPQYENGKPFAPIRWRELLNAGYAAVKAVQPGANVVAAGLAPFGDPVSANAPRTRPVAFLRSALCLDRALKKTCSDVTRADTFSLHPYAVDRPSRSAYDADDATVPDLSRITTVLKAARAARTVGPKLPRTWVTEVSYDSSPPDPKGIPLATRARYISEVMWRTWRAGAEKVIWYLMRDDAPTPSFASTYQSGIFYRDGRRKSDARAFRFPLLVTGSNAKRMNVWLRTPSAGTTAVQVRRGGKWATVNKGKLPVNGVASVKVPRSEVTAVRAISGKATSYVWTVK